jgi:LPXTG-motif cell wall-anchored protein
VPAGNGQSGKGSLATTGMSGAALLPIALIAAGVLAAGAFILLLRRRRSI